MSYFVYVIQSQLNGKIYIGQTYEIEKRLKRHNRQLLTKQTSFTSKNKGPWKLIYQEVFPTRKEAMKREKELKSYQGRKYIKKIILGP